MIKRYKQTEIEKLAEILKKDGGISIPNKDGLKCIKK